jgi:cobaltochelatase CobS
MELAERRSLSQMERGLLRQAVSRHPDWNSWRQSVFDPDGKPVNTSTISVNQLYDAAALFGIDVESTIAAAGNTAERSERRTRATPSVANNGSLSAAHASNDASQLAAVLQSILSKPQIDETAVRAIVDECLADSQPSIDESTIQGMIARALESATVRTVNLVKTDGSLAKMTGSFHPMFPTLLKAVSTGENVWLTGPTGSGKTHAARQVAEALSLSLGRELPFYSHGGMTMEHQLLGFVHIGSGVYQSTDFRQGFEHGGVILLDEVDNYDPAVSLALNAALANGHGSFPDVLGGVRRHPDCYIIAAANTWGSGATAEFVGRNKLDAAFLSRFPVKIAWSYDDAFERDLYGTDAASVIQNARRKAAARGLKVVIDPRHTRAYGKLLAAGFTSEEAANMTFLAGLTDQQKRELV